MRLGARVTVYVLVGLSVLVVVLPLLWMLAAALKTNAEIIDPQAPLIPTHLQW
jgi:ABC-type glycerol-3-phosphate transport system permease component